MKGLELIKRMAEMGYRVFPVESRGKKPLIVGWQNVATTDPGTIIEWSKKYHGCNWGVVATNFLAFDLDVKPEKGKDGISDLKKMIYELGDLYQTMTVRTGSGGIHLYYKPVPLVKNSTEIPFNGEKTAIDIRSGNGYLVAPGSINETGTPYRLILPLVPAEELPPLPTRWIEFLVRPPKNKRDEQEEGKSPTPALSDEEMNHLAHRCRRYLAKFGPSIQGEGGEKQFLKVANVIYYGFDLPDHIGRAILAEYNAKAKPPWTGKQLEHKIEEAKNANLKNPKGYLRNPKGH